MRKLFTVFIFALTAFSLFAQEYKISILRDISYQVREDKVILEFSGEFSSIDRSKIQTVVSDEEDSFMIIFKETISDSEKGLFEAQPASQNAITNIEKRTEAVENLENINFFTKVSMNLTELEFSTLRIKPTAVEVIFTDKISVVEILVEPIPKEDIIIKKSFEKPTRMNISILHNNLTRNKAYNLSTLILKYKKKAIEYDLDLEVKIINIVKVPLEDYKRNVLYFEKNYYFSAIYLTQFIKDFYVVMPFAPQFKRSDVDLAFLIIE